MVQVSARSMGAAASRAKASRARVVAGLRVGELRAVVVRFMLVSSLVQGGGYGAATVRGVNRKGPGAKALFLSWLIQGQTQG